MTPLKKSEISIGSAIRGTGALTDGVTTPLKNIESYITRAGHIRRPLPYEIFHDDQSALRVLLEIENVTGKQLYYGSHVPKDEEELKKLFGVLKSRKVRLPAPIPHRKLDRVVSSLQLAHFRKSLSLEDLKFIFTKRIQFHEIYHACISELPKPVLKNTRLVETSTYIDILLFIAELHDPRTDRLRSSRVKYEFRRGGTDPRTPEPILATWGWEKMLRNQKEFRRQSKELIAHMKKEYGKIAPYWMFCLATRCPDVDYMVLAFDKKYQFDGKASLEMKKKLDDEWDYFDSAYQTDHFKNRLHRFCCHFSMEMVGTPFVHPQLDDELHIYTQTIHVSEHQNQIRAIIPAFYRPNHLGTLLDTDFGDLKAAMEGRTTVRGAKRIRCPDQGTSPLGDDELIAAMLVARKVLEETFGCSKWLSYQYIKELVRIWWDRELDKKALSKKGENYVRHSRLSRVMREPSTPSPGDVKQAIPSRAKIIAQVNSQVDAVSYLRSEECHAWYKFIRLDGRTAKNAL